MLTDQDETSMRAASRHRRNSDISTASTFSFSSNHPQLLELQREKELNAVLRSRLSELDPTFLETIPIPRPIVPQTPTRQGEPAIFHYNQLEFSKTVPSVKESRALLFSLTLVKEKKDRNVFLGIIYDQNKTLTKAFVDKQLNNKLYVYHIDLSF
jgi:hypothetical protein